SAEVNGSVDDARARAVRALAAAESDDASAFLAAPVADSLKSSARVTAASLEPGQSIAGYRLIRKLGQGGMSIVWLATRADGVIKREVALKLPLLVLGAADQADALTRERD